MRLGSTSAGPMGSGFLPVQEGSQPDAPPVVTRSVQLPERYGIPLLELLVVDPYFIFISWEVTPEQLELAHSLFGTEFESRRLQVELTNVGSETVLTARELYGDVGRWFIELNTPGVWLTAQLRFVAGTSTYELNTAGPIFVPRDTPVEPERWDELHVIYGQSEKGELRIESLSQAASSRPSITLERVMLLGEAKAYGDHLSSSIGARRRVDTGALRPLLPASGENLND